MMRERTRFRILMMALIATIVIGGIMTVTTFGTVQMPAGFRQVLLTASNWIPIPFQDRTERIPTVELTVVPVQMPEGLQLRFSGDPDQVPTTPIGRADPFVPVIGR